jgi:hypothetical protein
LGHVAIEVVIMAPLLVVQLFVFPFVATSLTSKWADASREVTLQEAASQMASTIQQLYLSLNRVEISEGTITYVLNMPKEIASHSYTAEGSLITTLQPASTILLLNLTIDDTGNTATAQASLGPNAEWDEDSSFHSLSPNTTVIVEKDEDGTLRFSFG